MQRSFLHFNAFCAAFLCFSLLQGCTSISRGVTEAVLTHEAEDTRQCQMDGPAFPGLRQAINSHADKAALGTTKVLMVHGISHHTAGYSARFRDQLSDTLGLRVIEPQVKTFTLLSPQSTADLPVPIGTLRVSRHGNEDGSKTMLFYELTWSSITDGQKKSIAYDTDNTDGLARSGINKKLKGFLNQTVPDLLIYMGNGHNQITSSVRESVCWMFTRNWDELPEEEGAYICTPGSDDFSRNIAQDDFFFITHSLGSRITIDTLQNFATDGTSHLTDATHIKIRNAVADKKFTVYMMANQLPLLQLGRNAPAVTGRIAEYCGAPVPKLPGRVLQRLNIIAFSDPNDLLSYPVPDNFARDHIDSRICPQISNISLNVAAQRDLFGATSFADPLAAHNGYLDDERVIGLITDGMSHKHMAEKVREKCRWQEERPITEK